MKYKKYKIIVFFCLILFPFSSVFAGNCNASPEDEDGNYKVTYEITKFKVTKNYVTFAGWAALNHMDNLGSADGVSKEIANRTVWVVAYSGNWNTVYNEDANNPRCKRGKKCYSQEVTDNSTYNLYFMRCTDDACKLSSKRYYENRVVGGKRELDSCLANGPAGKEGGHCVYKNVGFSTRISLSDLQNKFGESNIQFRIVVRVVGKSGNKLVPKVDSAEIGFYPDACDSIFDQKCNAKSGQSNKTYSKNSNETRNFDGIQKTVGVRRSVTVGGMSDTVRFTATFARGYVDISRGQPSNSSGLGNPGKFQKLSGSYGNNCFTYGIDYEVDSFEEFHKYANYKGDGAGQFKGRLIHITSEDHETGWAWTSWVKSKGRLTLAFKEKVEETCFDTAQYCIGSGCGQYDSKTCSYSNTPEPVNLVAPVCNGDTHSSCDSWQKNLTCGKTIDSTYYYKISVDDFKSKTNGKTIEINSSNVRLTNEGGTEYYYFPIKFSANVNYTQNINLQLQGFSNGSTVKAGRSVNFAYDYLNQISWNFAGTYSENTSENNTYNNKIYVSFDSGSSSNVLPTDTILVSLKPGVDYLYAEPNSQQILYNVNFYHQFVRGQASKNLQDLDSDNVVDFRDSNDAKKSDFTQNYGTFKNRTVDKSNWVEGNIRTFNSSYQISQAYFKANGSGEVKYSDLNLSEEEYVKGDVGSKYYVPINASGNSFPFVSVNFDNLSLIDGATLSYNAQCSVNINNAINKIRYRSIDVTVPFPNNNIPKNWKEYSQFDSSFSRLKNQNISYETLFLKNRFSDLKSTLGDYSKYDDMTNDGNSNFITEDKFSTRQGKHCKSGEYSASCDKAQ